MIKWLLGLFKKKEAAPLAWPFPDVSEDFNPRPCECEPPKAKRKPRVAKATTRTTKKSAVIAKTARKKKAK